MLQVFFSLIIFPQAPENNVRVISNFTENSRRYSQARFTTALQRQNTEISKQIFPEKEYWGLSPYFHIHASVSDLYIPTIGLPILLQEICRPILGLYKSLTDTWMWKLGLKPQYSFSGNICFKFSAFCLCSAAEGLPEHGLDEDWWIGTCFRYCACIWCIE